MLAAVVPDEVVADFHLRTQREVHVLHAFQRVEVEPELRFRYHNQLAVHVRIVPDITEPAEGTEAMRKGCPPHLRQLEAVVRMRTRVAVLEIILIHQLHAERF